MNTKMLILFLLSFFKFSLFLLSLLYNTYGHFHESFLGNYLIKDYEIFNNLSFTTSDGYRRGYVRFAHFLLYLQIITITDYNNPRSDV